MNTKLNAPARVGRSCNAASSSPFVAICSASIAVTTSVSVVALPRRPASSASSCVLTRFPLCPRAIERTPSVLKTGCALSQVLEPVVEYRV